MPETPPVFLPYQKQLMQSVYDNPVTVVEKSRRTGYSWAMGGIASLIASAERSAGGQDVLYLGYNLEMAREFIDYVADFSKQILKVAANVQDTVFEDDTAPKRASRLSESSSPAGLKCWLYSPFRVLCVVCRGWSLLTRRRSTTICPK